jgi:hypothetical protein
MASDLQKHENPDQPSDPMRNGVRFPLHLKVRVETEESEFDAVTEDVSASGVLFRTQAEAPAINTQLTWTMVLPGEIMGAPTDTVVHCVGRVIWKNSGNGSQQIGAVIDSYRIAGGSQ